MQSPTYGTNTAWNTCTLNTSKKKLLIKKIQSTPARAGVYFNHTSIIIFFLPGINNSL